MPSLWFWNSAIRRVKQEREPSNESAVLMTIQPRFWPTVMTVFMLIALLGLGTWQVQRYTWKADLIEKLRSRSQASAVALPVADAPPAEIEFQRVHVRGTFLHQHEFFLLGRSRRGSPGLHVLTPLRRSDGKGYALIDRGWIPFDHRAPESRARGQVDGEVSFEGIIRIARGPNVFMPENDALGNNWYFIEPSAMARAAGIDTLPGYYVLSGAKETPGVYPIPRQWRVDIRNDHVEYAITWYLMAVILIVIYVLYHRQKA